MVGPSVSLPIFAGGRLKKTLELRDAQQQEAAIFYHKTVLQAWHDVVNALVARRLNRPAGHGSGRRRIIPARRWCWPAPATATASSNS